LQVTATKELQSRIGHFGLSPLRNELVVFCFSAMVAGLAGCVYAFIANLFNAVQFSPLASVTLLLAAVVGGTGSVWGALIAGVIFGYGPQLIGSLGKSGANAYPQIVSSALALILIVKVPGGLASTFGWAQRVAASPGTSCVPSARACPLRVCGGTLRSTAVATSDPRGYSLAGLAPVPAAASIGLVIPNNDPITGTPVPDDVKGALKSFDF